MKTTLNPTGSMPRDTATRTRTIARSLGAVALIATVAGACDLDLVNPTILARDEVDPNLLVNGAIERWMTGWNSGVISEWYASDEAIATPETSVGNALLDETGDLSANASYYSGYALSEMLDGRESTRIAVARAEELYDAAVDSAQRARAATALQRAKAYNAWFVTGMARRRGEQPIQPGGERLSEVAQYEHALGHMQDVIELAPAQTDSLRIFALAGSARLQWILGQAGNDEERLRAAIASAEEALALSPDLVWAFAWPYAYITDWYINNWGIALPGPGFEDIPIPANDATTPPGDMFVDADALWLIMADAHLRLGETEEARAALASTPLLANNHVGLAGRDPDGAPLTEAEIEAWTASLDADGIRHAIDELWRENFYLRGHRNLSNTGAPIFPVPMPDEALEIQ